MQKRVADNQEAKDNTCMIQLYGKKEKQSEAPTLK